MSKIIFVVCCMVLCSKGYTQSLIRGHLSGLAGQELRLEGFNGFEAYPIAQNRVSVEGSFEINYGNDYRGMGYLIAADNTSFLVVLSGEDIVLRGEAFSIPETIEILEGKENQCFAQYASEHPRREQVLSAWRYLEKIYSIDPLFAPLSETRQNISVEMKRIYTEDSLFLASLDSGSYVKWFLPIRKLVGDVGIIAQYRTEEIPKTIELFRSLDYTDPRLYKSGLFKDVIEAHFWLIENSGRSLDSVFIEMNSSIDRLIQNLISDQQKLNEATDYLFDLLERHSLFKSSEYLALKVLNDVSCTLNDDLAKQLETYRVMKKGNRAPNLKFNATVVAPGYKSAEIPKELSDVKSSYKVIVFGASWCPKCREDLPEIAKRYQAWKERGVEIVFVSLDENEQEFYDFIKEFPFISVCDYLKWDSPLAQLYYVFSTPTLYLLNEQHEIILRPNSVKHLDAWIEWYVKDMH